MECIRINIWSVRTSDGHRENELTCAAVMVAFVGKCHHDYLEEYFSVIKGGVK